MEYNKKLTIIIAAHKEYPMPEDTIYLPVHVGAYGKAPAEWAKNYARDDSGENISAWNPGFCELTGLYWAWKNLDAEYLGLAHYRRHFSMSKAEAAFSAILKAQEILPLLGDFDVFVPKKRNYYIESLYSHYAHTHYAYQLDAARTIVEQDFPDYLSVFDRVMKQTSGYMFNMMILRKDLFDQYCAWLFSILFSLKDRYGVKSLDPEENLVGTDEEGQVLSDFQSRFYGRISEIIFNVWLEQRIEKGAVDQKRIKELGYLNLEGENWNKKIISFLKAKFIGKKYEGSF